MYKKKKYLTDNHPMCNEEGVVELSKMRIEQLQMHGYINVDKPLPDFCGRYSTEVVIIEIEERYTLPFLKDIFIRDEEEGSEPCPWNSEEKCKRGSFPLKIYVRAHALYKGKWDEVYIEMNGDTEILEPLEYI